MPLIKKIKMQILELQMSLLVEYRFQIEEPQILVTVFISLQLHHSHLLSSEIYVSKEELFHINL